MTIEHRDKGNGKRLVVTTACGLCETSLRPRQGMADHLPHCPVRELYAEIGALHNGGPTPERVHEAILSDLPDADETPPLAADGGSVTCDDCGSEIQPENHKILIRERDEIEHLDLCLECQSKHPRDDQFTPATDGGWLTTAETQWCARCQRERISCTHLDGQEVDR